MPQLPVHVWGLMITPYHNREPDEREREAQKASIVRGILMAFSAFAAIWLMAMGAWLIIWIFKKQ